MTPPTLASIFNLNHPGTYIHWHWIQISLANLIVILAMLAVFVLAIVVPFSHRRDAEPLVESDAAAEPGDEGGSR